MAAAPCAELRQATKFYGKTKALNAFSIDVNPNEIVALLGPNGAGKTTAINALLGLVRLQSGTAHLFGESVLRGRSAVGVTPQEMIFPENITVQEAVEFVAGHHAHPRPVKAVLADMGLTALARRRCGQLSGGETRRLAVAVAFVGNPRLVFLDEPTTGLDVSSRRETWNAIRSFIANGGAVLLTTHDMDEAERLATRVVFLRHGHAVPRDEFERSMSANGGTIAFRCASVPVVDDPRMTLRAVDGGYELSGASTDDLIKALARGDNDFNALRILHNPLEEAYLQLQGEAE